MKSTRLQSQCRIQNDQDMEKKRKARDGNLHSATFSSLQKSLGGKDNKGNQEGRRERRVKGEMDWEKILRAKRTQCVYRLSDSHSHSYDHSHKSLLDQVFAERGWKEFTGYGGNVGGHGGEFEKGLVSGRSRSSSYDYDGDVTRARGRRVGEWEEFAMGRNYGEDWNLWWRASTMKSSLIRGLSPWQLINHIPKARTFSRKDCLARYLRRMHRTHGPIYDFSPISFNLPLEYTRLCSEHSRRARLLQYGDPSTCDELNLPFQCPSQQNHILNETHIHNHGSNTNININNNNVSNSDSTSDYEFCRDRNPIWICKPVGKSQGKGIHVFDRVAELVYDGSSVVQEYIVRPFLIGGYKWDLRIYACILSSSPLVIYAYREGLTRFATNKYDLDCLCNPFSHLTNTSLNKHSPAYKVNKEEIGSGCKWTLGRLRWYFQEHGIFDWLLWQRIMSILVLTIVGEAHTLTSLDVGSKCFELLGFDILVDQNLKPTLLEVNTNPGLGNDCLVDEIVKRPMLHDLMTLLGLPDARNESSSDQETTDLSKELKETENSEIQKQSEQPSHSIQKQGEGVKSDSGEKINSSNQKQHKRAYSASVTSSTSSSVRKRCSKFQRQASLDIQAQQSSLRKDKPKEKGAFNKLHKSKSIDSNSSDTQSKTPESLPWQEEDFEKEVGGWTRIFPFDSQTKQNKTQMSTHDIKLVIARMHNYLKLAQRLGRKGKRKEDHVYDMMAKHYGHLSTEPWHPIPLQTQTQSKQQRQIQIQNQTPRQ